MTTEERLAKLERELGRVKRRSRWLLAVVGLAVAVVGLAWTLTETTPPAHAQIQGAARPIDLEVVYKPMGGGFGEWVMYVLWDDGTVRKTYETVEPRDLPKPKGR